MKNYESPVFMLQAVNVSDVITNSELTDSPFASVTFEF